MEGKGREEKALFGSFENKQSFASRVDGERLGSGERDEALREEP